MANLYLFDLDEWLTKNSDIKHFRYIDDLVIFCKTEDQARDIYKELEKYFLSLNLSVHPLPTPNKTMLEDFDNGKISVLGVVMKGRRFLIQREKYNKFLKATVLPISHKTSLVSRKYKHKKVLISLDVFIKELNEVIKGWSSAYAFCDVLKEFSKLDLKIKTNLEKLLDACSISDKAARAAYIDQLTRLTEALVSYRKKV